MKPIVKQFYFFLIVGGSAAVLNFCSFSTFYSLMRLPYQQAATLAYIISVIAHFFGNRYFTFQAHRHSLRAQLPRYLILTAFNYGITLSVITFVVQHLQLSPYIGLACAIAGTVLIGFLIAKHWVFAGLHVKSDVNC